LGAEIVRESAGAINKVGGSSHAILNVASGTTFSIRNKETAGNITFRRVAFSVRRL
jgi:hypothetical protein